MDCVSVHDLVQGVGCAACVDLTGGLSRVLITLIFDKQPESNKSDAVNSGSETGQESMSWQAVVPWCSSCNGLMGSKGRWT